MEIIKYRKKYYVSLVIVFGILFMISGCQKKFWEYECVWKCDEPYIYIETHGHIAYMEIDGEIKELETAWENDGTGIDFWDPSISDVHSYESVMWITKCEIKKGRLYLTVITDNVSDCEGETFILEPQEYESTSESTLD